MNKYVLGLMLAAAPTAILAQTAKPVAVDDGKRVATAVFGLQPNMSGVRISPDGNKLAYSLASGGTTHLAFIDLTKPDPKPVIIASASEYREIGDRTVASWRWVGNENVVVTLASREDAFGQRGDVTRLFAYNIRTGKKTPLAWDGAVFAAAGILHIDHDRNAILLQRTTNRSGTERLFNPEVLRVDVITGRTEIAMRQNPVVDGWAADSKGVVRVGYGSDSRSGKQSLLYRSNERDTLKTAEKTVDKDFTGAGIRPQFFVPDKPDMAYVTSNKDGHSKVYLVNMKTMELGKPVFERKGYDVDGVYDNFDGTKVVGFTASEEGPRYHWIDPDYKQIQSFLDAGFGRGNAQIISSDRAANRFVIYVGAPNQAGAYYLYDTRKGDFNQIGWRNVLLKDRKLNPVSTIRYRASDGEMIPAVLTMPRHRRGKNLPMVMITHGGPFGVRDEERYDGWAQAMAELGYVVLQPNYRGSGGYGADFIKKGRSDGFGLRMQDDLNDGVAYLAAQGIVDPKRACMMGWSYGGYASARAAQRDPDRWRCTIAGAGVYDLPAMRSYDVNYLGTFGSNYLAKGAADLKSVSPTHNAKGKWAPILIVHGVRDQRVPINQARGLVSALKSSGKRRGVDYDYIEQPKNTHNLPYDDVSIEWLEGAERWLAKHNPAYLPNDADKPVPVGVTVRTAAK